MWPKRKQGQRFFAGERVLFPFLVFLGLSFFPFSLFAKDAACLSKYQQAANEYRRLEKSGGLNLSACRRLMSAFEAVGEGYPDCEKADDAWYMVGQLGLLAYQGGGNRADLDRALHAFQVLITRYPKSSLVDDAHYFSAEIYLLRGERDKAIAELEQVLLCPGADMAGKATERLRELKSQKPKPDPAPKKDNAKSSPPSAPTSPPATPPASKPPSAPKPTPATASAATSSPPLPSPPADPLTRTWTENETPPLSPSAQLTSLRTWSNRDYTRVVMELSEEVPYQPPHLLKPDPELGTPPRLYIDFQGARLAEDFKDKFTYDGQCYTLLIGDGFLKKARAGQYAPAVVRVVLDIERIDHFRAFPLRGSPFRYVIDVYGSAAPGSRESGEKNPPPAASPKVSPPPGVSPPEPLAGDQTVSSGAAEKSAFNGPKVLVVLDPGHGGKDPGAIGPSGLKEKDVTLAIALLAKKELEARRPDLKVVLTRENDQFLGLVDRTALANTMAADLFISIHCNASPNRSARGIETYYLDNTTDRASLRLAAKENFVPETVMEDSRDTTNLILADLITTSKVEASVPLAESLQSAMIQRLRQRFPNIVNHGVKKAPFWVLTGATMPCALIETSFISNPEEEKRLASPEYQQALAEAIAVGLINYLVRYPLPSPAL